jgi:serine/threonine protein kinase
MSEDDRNPVEVLAEEFVARYRAGERPSIAEYAARYPDLGGEIEELFPAATLLEDVKVLSGAPTARPHGPPAPEQIGDYRIVREIGRGGMGIVYEAEQVSLGRRVALKVLPAHLHLAPEQRERFRREARAAGQLHHSNIVPVFGVGEQDGLHYYVMQLIPGEGLDRVLARLLRGRAERSHDTEALTDRRAVPVSPTTAISLQGPLPAALSSPTTVPQEQAQGFPSPDSPHYSRRVAQLGLQAAEALACAHEKGILHRDVKPANLLLDDRGTLWVTDFGLAKHLSGDDLTQPGEVAGTLRYSAPERFKGASDARADLFSLGLTLYEFLALRPAYDATDPAELLLQVMEARIARPRAHNPAVPRDLETVVLKVLAAEPARRYARAADLAHDLRRFLADRPVKARRASAVEHALRWCRRNPAVAGLSAALFLACVLGLGGVLWKWREASAHLAQARRASEETAQALVREEAQRTRADEQRRLAEGNLDVALLAFERIAGRLAPPRPDAGADGDDEAPAGPVVSPEAAAILEDLVGFYERFAATNSGDPRLRRDTARALRQAGTIRLRLGQYPQAVQALRKAAALGDGGAGPLDRARLHNELGTALRGTGRLGEASKEHRRALAALAQPPQAGADVRHEQARSHNLLGAIQVRMLDLGAAEQSQRTALALLAKLVEQDAKSPEHRHTQARAYRDLSVALRLREKRAEAGEASGKALAILEALAADFPAVADYRAELAESLLAVPPRPFLPRWSAEASKRTARALELAGGLAARHPAVPEYQLLLARARQRQGTMQAARGRLDEGLKNLRAALALHSDLAERFPSTPGYRMPALEARLALGDALRLHRELAESEKVLRESLEEVARLAKLLPRNRYVRLLLGRHHRSLSQTLQRQGKTAEADEQRRKGDEAMRQAEEMGKARMG